MKRQTPTWELTAQRGSSGGLNSGGDLPDLVLTLAVIAVSAQGRRPSAFPGCAGFTGGFQSYWDAKWDLNLWRFLLRMLLAKAVS